MDNKKFSSIFLIASSIIILFSLIFIHLQMDSLYNEKMVLEMTSCIVDGKCIHNNPYGWLFTILYIILVLNIFYGAYVLFFDSKKDEVLDEIIKTTKDLERIKKEEKKEREFEAFLRGFYEDEKKILKIIKEQEGVWQSTLRIKSGLSKATLSLLLQELESKGHITRVKKGKTYEIYLKF